MQWYAVYTLPRWEKKVAQNLKEAGFESYCPLYKVQRQWKDRKKLVELPILKGYVLVKTEDQRMWQVLDVRGIINFVYWNKRPAKIKERDITELKSFLEEYSSAEITITKLEPNDIVEITAGVLMHQKGIVRSVKGNSAILQIPALGVYFTATLSLEKMRKVPSLGNGQTV